MKYKNVLLGICIVVPMLLLISILWRDSEQQYVTMTNLGLRLRVLHQSELDARQFSQMNWPSWEMVWKPMVTAMQLEVKHAATRNRGFHLSRTMYGQLLRFSKENISDDTDLKKILSQFDFSDEVVEARAPFVFSENEQQYSLSTVAWFRDEISVIMSSEADYSAWLSPILQQQKLHDISTTCKTMAEIKAFKTYSDRIRRKCATHTNKWPVCSDGDEPVARHMKELLISSEANLKKFKSRWFAENVNDLCSDI